MAINKPTPSFAGDPFENYEVQLSTDYRGFMDIDITYYAENMSDALTLMQFGKECPLVESGLVLAALFKYGTANQEEAGYFTVVLHWKGISPNISESNTIYPGYQPRGESQPIQTHPNWLEWAGTWENPNPNSRPQYDMEGVFIQFDRVLLDGSPNPYAGMTDFYQPGLSVTDERVIAITEIDVADNPKFKVGRISVPDLAELPLLRTSVFGMQPEDRNYLLDSIEIEDFANTYLGLKRTWIMSGPWGWDTDIYQYEDTGTNLTA